MITIGSADIDLSQLDGKEINPGIFLIGTPTWNKHHKEWRCLANMQGALCLISLNISIKGKS